MAIRLYISLHEEKEEENPTKTHRERFTEPIISMIRTHA
jgi:hypothetical protein